MKNKKIIWITWEKQRRNRELSKAFNIPLYEFGEIDDIKNSLVKYTKGLYKTTLTLIRESPDLVYCQNPSLILSFYLVFFKKLYGIKVIVDAHNAGIFPGEGRSGILLRFSNFIHKRADYVIVTNKILKDYIEENGGKAFILPDKIPDIKSHPASDKLSIGLDKSKFNIVFISTFSADEPYWEVIKAARELDDGIRIYITGNYLKKNINIKKMPNNIVFTGYIDDDLYEELLTNADITLSLTTRNNCMLCSAYESVAVGKPMVISNTDVLRDYFSSGMIYTENTANDIKLSIQKARDQKNMLEREIKKLKNELISNWENSKEKMLQIQDSLL